LGNSVVTTRSTYCDLYENLASSFDIIGWPDLEKHDVITVKINLCDARTPDTGAITHPLFLDALLRYIRDKNGPLVRINVVESEATVALPDLFIEWFGFLPVLKRWGAHYINLSKDKRIIKKIDGRFFKRIAVPATIARSNCIISLAKLKTNGLTKITCALKNQFGCLPYKRKAKFHKYIDDVIVDANLAMRPHLSIVDGIIAHVGMKGPAFGQAVPANLLVVGNDPVAVDSFCARVLGFNPYFVGHVRKAAEARIGVIRDYDLTLHGFSKMPRVNSEFSLLESVFTKVAVGLFKRGTS